MESAYTYNMMIEPSLPNWMEPSTTTMKEKDPPPVEGNSISDEYGHSADNPNNIGDEDDDNRCSRKRTGKGHQSKNLEAERKRRKKLNDRLYSLRALVPNITKLDRGAILGDAINYVKELQKQVKDLQIELEQDSDDDIVRKCTDHNSTKNGPRRGNGGLSSDFYNETFYNNREENTNEAAQQMEPQVEVFQIDENELFVRVFCEHKHGGFVRLMEGLSSLGFQVINVNATRHTCLVSNVFTVEKRDCETFVADHVRELLLELARNPIRAWP
ncbi:hypothetical protein OROGR_009800 [Orobanche gracilis]